MTNDDGRKPEGAPERTVSSSSPPVAVITFALFQSCCCSRKRAVAPFGQLGDGDIRLPGHQFQRLAAQQPRHDRQLMPNGKTLRPIPFSVRRGACTSFGGAWFAMSPSGDGSAGLFVTMGGGRVGKIRRPGFPAARLQLKILTNDVLGEELFSYHNGNMPLESMSYVAQMRPTRRSLA